MTKDNYKRIVIKIGSSLLFNQGEKGAACTYPLSAICSQIAQLNNSGKEVLLVSSGAVASGMSILKLHSRPRELTSLQATAALGQHVLMADYQRCFAAKGLNCAQVLLTWDDFDKRDRYLNAKNTLLKLLELNTVPIINENDTVSTEEIKFGDNDKLSALVSKLVDADLLVILSDVDGLLDKNKKVIPLVEEINNSIRSYACPSSKKTCVGGMISKIDAAKVAVDSGIPCVIANGRENNIIIALAENPQKQGTLFVPKRSLRARQHWIAFGSKPKGTISVDEGAKRALIHGKSLLSVGVTECAGDFNSGDIVSLVDKEKVEFCRAKVNFSAKEIEKVKGKRWEKEIAHRDNIVVL